MAAFMVAYPIATFMMETIAASNPNIEEWLQ
jgi:hypothetical protein